MVNYGYDRTIQGYKPEKEKELQYELSLFVSQFRDSNGQVPYVELNGLYPGVRIRRITHLSEEGSKELVKGADEIFKRVMDIQF